MIAKIRGRGLLPDDAGQYRYRFKDLKPRLTDLRRLPVVTIADTEIDSSTPTWIGACADEMGATYYATKHNRYNENDTPILICFDAPSRRNALYRLLKKSMDMESFSILTAHGPSKTRASVLLSVT